MDPRFPYSVDLDAASDEIIDIADVPLSVDDNDIDDVPVNFEDSDIDDVPVSVEESDCSMANISDVSKRILVYICNLKDDDDDPDDIPIISDSSSSLHSSSPASSSYTDGSSLSTCSSCSTCSTASTEIMDADASIDVEVSFALYMTNNPVGTLSIKASSE